METPTNHLPFGNSRRYQRHQLENTALYPIVEQHLSSLQDELRRHETALPHFVLNEFDDYLRCGRLEHGFLRVKCNGCSQEHLVDHVIPSVPARQWVLTFPWPLRLLFASQPDTLSRVLAIVVRAIETDLIHRASLTRRSHARTGVVTLIQRFGSALNLNVHLHMIVLDGVYIEHNGRARFHPVGAPSRETLERLLDRLIKRTLRVLLRDGALAQDREQPWLNLRDPDTLDQLNAASVRAQRPKTQSPRQQRNRSNQLSRP